MSWKPQQKVQGEWCDNGQRFATKEEAHDSARARFAVWTLPSECRAVESDDPVNYKRIDGRDEMIVDKD